MQARRALRALKGLVKLQALVRGYLVRKEVDATLHYMQALITSQDRVCARHLRMHEEAVGKSVHMKQMQKQQQDSCPKKPIVNKKTKIVAFPNITSVQF